MKEKSYWLFRKSSITNKKKLETDITLKFKKINLIDH